MEAARHLWSHMTSLGARIAPISLGCLGRPTLVTRCLSAFNAILSFVSSPVFFSNVCPYDARERFCPRVHFGDQLRGELAPTRREFRLLRVMPGSTQRLLDGQLVGVFLRKCSIFFNDPKCLIHYRQITNLMDQGYIL